MATKPSGRPDKSSAVTTPINPKGATVSTIKSRWKLLSSNMSTVSMMSSMIGTMATTEACDFALSSTVPPTSIL